MICGTSVHDKDYDFDSTILKLFVDFDSLLMGSINQ